MRERLKTAPSDVICEYLFRPAIEDDSKRSFHNMVRVNLAHALMLERQEIISKEDATKLLDVLVSLGSGGPDSIELNPQLEDYYFNFESYIVSQVGLDTGGKLHTGRSRNDLHGTLTRMNVRDAILNLYTMILDLRSMLLKIAREHTGTVLTGYTHMQPAQPITLAHYFTAVAQAVERDWQRLEGSYKRLNYCPLGSGAFAGTSFDIDREFTAELLGFYGPIENSLDAIASRDYLLEISSSFATLGSTINRLATDLYIWSTDEFSLIEVDDSLAACSSIMPQKKNPITLEHVKSKTSHLLSAYVSVFSCLKGVPYGHCRDVAGESVGLFWEACSQLEAILQLLNATIQTMKINTENMGFKANRNYSTVTELADALVRQMNLPFRVAHQIVGSVVGDCVEAGLSCSDITVEMLNTAVGNYTQSCSLDWTQEELDNILDSAHSVNNKRSLGSPAPGECDKLIAALRARLDQDINTYWQMGRELNEAYERLNNEVIRIISS
ncbi:MAG: argininosuccinate lyase [bacterium]|jgi:argininosuccinate lyase